MAKDILKDLPSEFQEKLKSMPAEQRAQLEEKLASMNPEQIKMMMEKMKSMSPEEREAMRKKRASMSPEELAELSKKEEKQRMMQKKMAEMQASGKGMKRKANNFKGSIKRLISYFLRQKTKFIVVIISAILATVFSVATPYIIARALDAFQENIVSGTPFNYRRISFLVLLLGVIYLMNFIFSMLQTRLMVSITQTVVYQLRKEVDRKLMKLPFNYFDTKQKGDILSRITNDIENVGTSVQQSVTQLITSTLTIIGCLVLMFSISWQITLICLVCLVCGIFVSKKLLGKSQGYFRAQGQKLGELNGLVEESYSGMYVVKAFGVEDKKIAEFIENNEELYKVSRKAQFQSSIINPSSNLFNNIAYIFICVVGAFSFIKGKLSLGNISALIQYQKQYSTPVTQIANVLNSLQSAVASAERVFELLDEEVEKETAEEYKRLDNVKGRVEFSHLKFGYTPDKILMNDIDVNVKPGQMVAIVGPTGAGKTTLVNLLMRFYEPSGGAIKIDGMDIKDMTRHDLRDIFGMVLQDTWLYSGTIYENIAYGNQNTTKEQVINAAKSAQIEFFFETMPDGYETMLNEDATNISQGQKQLLTIARAMVADPKILILDEATSSVDTRTEFMIQKAMNNLLKNRTSFVIAHRLSTIKDADLILYMENGNILEQGNHNELMDKAGKYAELYNSQFAKEEEEFHGLIYHDFESQMAPKWKHVVETFGKERGIPVRYVTSDMIKYEKGLASQLLEDNPPAVMKFRLGMIRKFSFIHDLFEPLDDLKSAKNFLNKNNVGISYSNHVIGLPYYTEGIGLVYNKRIMKKYFALPNRIKNVDSVEEIKSQKNLIAVVEDMYAHKEELGIDGVFPNCAFAKNNEDQWKSHIMSLPVFYEAQDKGEPVIQHFDFKYSENLKKLYDMFFKNCAGSVEDFSESGLPDSVKAFMAGKVPMILYLHLIRTAFVRKNKLTTPEQLKNVVDEEDLGIMPIYFGHEEEEKQNVLLGLAWVHAVNKNAGEEQKQYAKEFIDWIANSETGRKLFAEMGYILPYEHIKREDVLQDALELEVYDYMHNDELDKIYLAHTSMPNGPYRNSYAESLLAYAKGEKSWDDVCDDFVSSWTDGVKMNEEKIKEMFAEVLMQ